MSIIYVGMDVHKDSYSLCCFNPSKNQYFGEVTIPADYKRVVKYLHKLNEQNANCLEYRLCYEAGCLGYVLRQKLEDEGFNCVIVAPTTLLKDNRRVKTDRRDARSLAQNLAFGTCSLVRIPNQEDNMVREYLLCVMTIKENSNGLSRKSCPSFFGMVTIQPRPRGL